VGSFKQIYIFLFTILSLCGCGGGGSSNGAGAPISSASMQAQSSNGATSFSQTSQSSSSRTEEFTDGRIADLWISGLAYTTTSGMQDRVYVETRAYQSTYLFFSKDDNIQFNIGNLLLPETIATNSITLSDIFKTFYSTNEKVNLIRLLIFINTNKELLSKSPSYLNAIMIPEKFSDKSLNIFIKLEDLYLDPVDFENSENVKKFISEFYEGSALVSKQEAIDYLNSVMKTARLVCINPDPMDRVIGGYYSRCADSDGDGVDDEYDAFPWNADEFEDINSDGMGDLQDRQYTDLPIKSANGYAFNKDKGHLFITTKALKRVSIIDVVTKQLVKVFDFEYYPGSMELSPDNTHLYVALYSSEIPISMLTNGKVAIINLDQMSIEKVLDLDIDPYDLTAVENDRLIITSINRWELHQYEISTGNRISTILFDNLYPRSITYYDAAEKILRLVYSGNVIRFTVNDTVIQWVPTEYTPNYNQALFEQYSFIDSHKLWISKYGDFFRDGDTQQITADSLTGLKGFDYDRATGQGYTLGVNGIISYFNLTTFLRSGYLRYNIFDGFPSVMPWITDYDTEGALYVYQQHLYVVHVNMNGGLQLITIPQPCLDCAQSIAPSAQFTVSLNPAIFNETIFDASASVDAEDGGNLQFRWDVDGDGQWDTYFSRSPVLTHEYFTEGTRAVRLEVKDSSGLSDIRTLNLMVAASTYSGRVPVSPLFSDLSISLTDVVHDKQHKKAYVLSMFDRKMHVVNLVSGTVEKEFEFSFKPSAIVITPDNKKVYMALSFGNNSSQWYQEDQKGIILIFDTELQSFVSGFDVKTDPYEMSLNELGELAITSGSGQHGKIHLYDPVRRTFLGEFGDVYRNSRFKKISSKPLAGTDWDPIASFNGINYWIYPDIYLNGKTSWEIPDSDNVFTNAGAVIKTDDGTTLINMGKHFEDVFFEPERNLIFTLDAQNGDVEFYSMSDYSLLGALEVEGRGVWIIAQDDKISIFSAASFSQVLPSTLIQLPHPCLQCK
jgi:DNA-binding beta-propeller fold protein YncE